MLGVVQSASEVKGRLDGGDTARTQSRATPARRARRKIKRRTMRKPQATRHLLTRRPPPRWLSARGQSPKSVSFQEDERGRAAASRDPPGEDAVWKAMAAGAHKAKEAATWNAMSDGLTRPRWMPSWRLQEADRLQLELKPRTKPLTNPADQEAPKETPKDEGELGVAPDAVEKDAASGAEARGEGGMAGALMPYQGRVAALRSFEDPRAGPKEYNFYPQAMIARDNGCVISMFSGLEKRPHNKEPDLVEGSSHTVRQEPAIPGSYLCGAISSGSSLGLVCVDTVRIRTQPAAWRPKPETNETKRIDSGRDRSRDQGSEDVGPSTGSETEARCHQEA